jgi:hypothetical protein
LSRSDGRIVTQNRAVSGSVRPGSAILKTFIRNGPWFPRLVTFLGYQGSKLAAPFFPVSRERSLSRFPDRNRSRTIATADMA